MRIMNEIRLDFPALPENESLARMVVSAFLVQVNPTMSVISEVRTAVSEAVTNAIVHGYAGTTGTVVLRAALEDGQAIIEVEDYGCGMADVQKAMQPFYTSHPEQERTGIGFSLMQSFMDGVSVTSSPGSGTLVRMTKRLEA